MVEIIIEPKWFSAKGHANYSKIGTDIVCSGISSITQTIALTLEEECNAFIYSDKDMLFVSYSEYKEKERLLIRTLIRGLKEIEKCYPKNIEVKISKEVDI